MQLKQTVAAVALGLAFAAGAQAGPLGELGELSFDKLLVGDGYKVGSNTAFEHEFTFTVAGDLQNNTILLDMVFSAEAYLNLSSLTVQLFTGDNSIDPIASLLLDDYFNPGQAGYWKDAIWFTADSSVSQYTLKILGTTGSDYAGRYNFNIGASPSAVPEPETYAMMLAGLGMIGTMVRRRRKGL
ncbi:MAG: FxDxF family PEP-CTERM protein [Azoarcus sp.]|jgi:hypothetical protein|nr:FxDxF family PEP-CTERM protein [Azoarcus sp.]